MTPNEMIQFIRYVWNKIATEEQCKYLLENYPTVLLEFNLQKRLLGGNQFSTGGLSGYEGHKSPINLILPE